MTTYQLEKNDVKVTIENKKRFWLLTVHCDNRIIIISNSCKVWNTLREAKKFANKLLSNY